MSSEPKTATATPTAKQMEDEMNREPKTATATATATPTGDTPAGVAVTGVTSEPAFRFAADAVTGDPKHVTELENGLAAAKAAKFSEAVLNEMERDIARARANVAFGSLCESIQSHEQVLETISGLLRSFRVAYGAGYTLTITDTGATLRANGSPVPVRAQRARANATAAAIANGTEPRTARGSRAVTITFSDGHAETFPNRAAAYERFAELYPAETDANRVFWTPSGATEPTFNKSDTVARVAAIVGATIVKTDTL